MNIFETKINYIISTITAILSAILGDFWFLHQFDVFYFYCTVVIEPYRGLTTFDDDFYNMFCLVYTTNQLVMTVPDFFHNLFLLHIFKLLQNSFQNFLCKRLQCSFRNVRIVNRAIHINLI